MAGHPRIETPELANLCTTRSRNSELWLVNNKGLEHEILGLIAKFQTRYGVILYSLALQGNHIHLQARFPLCNRADFMRDLNSGVAKAVGRYALRYPGGRFWARRYSNEFLGEAADIENYFFYVALQPVNDALVEHPREYPGYNCFMDSIKGVKRKFKVVRRWEYNDKKRWNSELDIKDVTDEYELVFSRLPGYESMPQDEYEKMMLRKFEVRRRQKVAEIRGQSRRFMGRLKLKQLRAGAVPKKTKQGTKTSFRPRVLCEDPIRREELLVWYFDIHFGYKSASKLFRQGCLQVEFPPGTYRPPLASGIPKVENE